MWAHVPSDSRRKSEHDALAGQQHYLLDVKQNPGPQHCEHTSRLFTKFALWKEENQYQAA
jgi:hypothetical protein